MATDTGSLGMPVRTHDNEDHPAPPDAHGQAAYLLAESMLLALRDRGTITATEAVEIVEVALDVKREVDDAWGDTPEARTKSIALLNALSASLRSDV